MPLILWTSPDPWDSLHFNKILGTLKLEKAAFLVHRFELLVLQRIWVQTPAPMWWLMIVYNSSSRVTDTSSLPGYCMHTVHLHALRQTPICIQLKQ